VKGICVLHNTIIEKEGVGRYLTDVTVQIYLYPEIDEGGFQLRPKTLEISFLCIWKNIPYDIITK
jgi:hypothetical protein